MHNARFVSTGGGGSCVYGWRIRDAIEIISTSSFRVTFAFTVLSRRSINLGFLSFATIVNAPRTSRRTERGIARTCRANERAPRLRSYLARPCQGWEPYLSSGCLTQLGKYIGTLYAPLRDRSDLKRRSQLAPVIDRRVKTRKFVRYYYTKTVVLKKINPSLTSTKII